MIRGVNVKGFSEDLRIFKEKHKKENGLFKYVYYPDIRVAFLYRLSRWFYTHKLRPISYVIVMINDFFHGVWIGPRVEIGEGVSFGHPRGIVINPGTKIGKYCTMLNQVTLGGPNVTIGDYVELGAGAKIISTTDRNIYIGDHCLIGAGSVVVKSFENGRVLGGVPAKEIKMVDQKKWCARHPYYPICAKKEI